MPITSFFDDDFFNYISTDVPIEITEFNPYEDSASCSKLMRDRLHNNNVYDISYFRINDKFSITTFKHPKLDVRCFMLSNMLLKTFDGLFSNTRIMGTINLSINSLDTYYEGSLVIPTDEMELFQLSTIHDYKGISWNAIKQLSYILDTITSKTDKKLPLGIIDDILTKYSNFNNIEMDFLKSHLISARKIIDSDRQYFSIRINDDPEKYKWFNSTTLTEEDVYDLLMEDGEYSWIQDAFGSKLVVTQITKKEFEDNSTYY